MTLAGDAALVATHPHIDIIPFVSGQDGAVWTTDKKAVVRGFDVTFTAVARSPIYPFNGDGFSFVVQNDSATPPLLNGGWMGYSSIDNCLAVEFDPFQNAETEDPPYEHVAVMP